MGPLIKIQSAVEQVVPERCGTGRVAPPREGRCPQSPGWIPSPRALPKALPRQREREQGQLQGHLQPQVGTGMGCAVLAQEELGMCKTLSYPRAAWMKQEKSPGGPCKARWVLRGC